MKTTHKTILLALALGLCLAVLLGQSSGLAPGYGYVKALSTDSTADSLEGTDEISAGTSIQSIDLSRVTPVTRHRGVRILFAAVTTADNATGAYRVLAWTPIRGAGNEFYGWRKQLVCFGTLTFAANVNIDGIFPSSSGYDFADTATLTVADSATSPPGVWQTLVTADGGGQTPGVYSPANDASPAEVVIPDLFDASFIEIELDKTANVTSLNALVCLTR